MQEFSRETRLPNSSDEGKILKQRCHFKKELIKGENRSIACQTPIICQYDGDGGGGGGSDGDGDDGYLMF